MISIYYLCGGYALANFSKLLKSVINIYPDKEKKIILITNNLQMNMWDGYNKDNVIIEVKNDNELSIIPLNKVNELQKFISNESEYSIFINPNAIFEEELNDLEIINSNKLYFGYINNEENNNSQEYFGFGSLIYGPTELFNNMIKFSRDYIFIENENHTDEQKFIRYIENNLDKTEYRESSDIYKFI